MFALCGWVVIFCVFKTIGGTIWRRLIDTYNDVNLFRVDKTCCWKTKSV